MFCANLCILCLAIRFDRNIAGTLASFPDYAATDSPAVKRNEATRRRSVDPTGGSRFNSSDGIFPPWGMSNPLFLSTGTALRIQSKERTREGKCLKYGSRKLVVR